MNAHVRIFEDKPATRAKVPLLVGLFGASGSGKTFSALRLAKGIQTVSGGDIFVIDTESRRALHYADKFTFRHVEFGAPFGSLDYLAALEHCVKRGAGVIVVDSMSHEHEGTGGYLMSQKAELDRIAGDNEAERKKKTYSAWINPAEHRRRLINGVLQLNANFVFCFRAKEKLKIKGGGQSPTELGYMPIAGEEFLFEMGLNCLLLPGANGKPEWNPTRPGERSMVKLPEQFRNLFGERMTLNEQTGEALAQWAAGGDAPAAQERRANPLGGAATTSTKDTARAKAGEGKRAFNAWWERLSEREQDEVAEIADELFEIGQRVGERSFQDSEAA